MNSLNVFRLIISIAQLIFRAMNNKPEEPTDQKYL